MLKVLPKALPMLRGFNLIKQMQESKAVIGLNMLSLWKDRGTLAPWIDPLAELIADGTVEPVVHEAVPFDRAGTRTGSWPSGATSARSCSSPTLRAPVALVGSRACRSCSTSDFFSSPSGGNSAWAAA